MITHIYNWLRIKDEDVADEILIGLSVGALIGLLFGFTSTLGLSLTLGLVFALIVGILAGAKWGFVSSVLSGVSSSFFYGVVNIFKKNPTLFPDFIPLWFIILIIFLIAELLFWLDRRYPESGINVLWFTAKRKLEALIESVIIIILFNNVMYLLTHINLSKYFSLALKGLGYIWTGLIVLLIVSSILLGIIYLNSLKFKIKTKKRKGK